MNVLKKIIATVFTFALLAVIGVYHFSFSSAKEEIEKERAEEYFEIFSSAYKAYDISKFETAREKTLQCAEELYKKDFATGEADEEFNGVTVAKYFLEAFNEADDRLTNTDRLALGLPVILIALTIVAIVLSIAFGLSAIQRLSFDNDATVFKN